MPDETPFRIALIAVLVPAALVGVYHRLQAAATREKISHREEGYLFATVLRLSGLATLIAIITWLVAPAATSWAHLPLPPVVRWGFVALGFGCTGLLYWTLSSLGKNLTDTVVTRANATLVTRGPYHWVRHPFYVTGALMLLAITGLSANGLIGALGIVPFVFLAIRTPKEEQMLVARFGEAYEDYIRRTGRFVPHFIGGPQRPAGPGRRGTMGCAKEAATPRDGV